MVRKLVVQRAWTVKVTFQIAWATSMLLLLTALVGKRQSVVVVPAVGGEATVDKDIGGTRTADKSEKS